MPRVEYNTRYESARPSIASLLSSLPHFKPCTVMTRLCILCKEGGTLSARSFPERAVHLQGDRKRVRVVEHGGGDRKVPRRRTTSVHAHYVVMTRGLANLCVRLRRKTTPRTHATSADTAVTTTTVRATKVSGSSILTWQSQGGSNARKWVEVATHSFAATLSPASEA